jgi:hypothetical protein
MEATKRDAIPYKGIVGYLVDLSIFKEARILGKPSGKAERQIGMPLGSPSNRFSAWLAKKYALAGVLIIC